MARNSIFGIAQQDRSQAWPFMLEPEFSRGTLRSDGIAPSQFSRSFAGNEEPNRCQGLPCSRTWRVSRNPSPSSLVAARGNRQPLIYNEGGQGSSLSCGTILFKGSVNQQLALLRRQPSVQGHSAKREPEAAADDDAGPRTIFTTRGVSVRFHPERLVSRRAE
jgi:hypothetical protein